ncbi:MAG: hypothetical protein FJZ67_00650 [Bacteroidetes bacterium]|nr:hypothetical protein [Bacteroidota bacterium]
MAKKVLTIIVLALLLAGFLYLRPFLFKKEAPPRLIDRLPEAEFMGKANILELARETTGMMFYNKVSYRDFTSYEFILSQSKMYGVDLQKPAYLFGNENGNLGAILHVSDSSKTSNGIDRIRNFVTIRDSLIYDTKIWYIPKQNAYIHYGKNYLLIYSGSNFRTILNQVLNSKIYKQRKEWNKFLSLKEFKNDHLVIYSNWKKLNRFGIETALFAHDSDSISFNLKSYLKKKTPFHIKKKSAGIAFASIANSKKSVEFHLDIEKLNEHPEDSLYVSLVQIGRKFGFPIVEFLNAWNGDLCFAEGGTQKIQEKYVTTELDEEFNVSEVEKTREVEVQGYSLLISTNDKGYLFVNRLFQKGFLRQDEKKFRVLFSPPLNFIQTRDFISLYSGSTAPKFNLGEQNRIFWTNQETRYSFQLDSLNTYEIFGSMQIPVARLFKRNKIN